ncbi:hypothetical protein ASJ81_19980 [Methanosarcina spelaei]|uniref:Uncharacterized protein n=1 Tax=Methanosarcina spelaei TaxID=1036679 RepID=A0A2A2HTJ8_9EURY|nr:hypothetical protein ASJ81_19980 [Methanosarcina spelaei]
MSLLIFYFTSWRTQPGINILVLNFSFSFLLLISPSHFSFSFEVNKFKYSRFRRKVRKKYAKMCIFGICKFIR